MAWGVLCKEVSIRTPVKGVMVDDTGEWKLAMVSIRTPVKGVIPN